MTSAATFTFTTRLLASGTLVVLWAGRVLSRVPGFRALEVEAFTPDGRPAVAVAAPALPLEDGEEPWFAEAPGQREPRRFLLVDATGSVLEELVVAPTGGWGYLDALTDMLVGRGWTFPTAPYEVCPHGMSADLCSGPGHYPMD
jgi:hypothetical protein